MASYWVYSRIIDHDNCVVLGIFCRNEETPGHSRNFSALTDGISPQALVLANYVPVRRYNVTGLCDEIVVYDRLLRSEKDRFPRNCLRRKLEKERFLPTKQIPILSLLDAVGKPSRFAISRTSVLARWPIGNITCR
jgi:hypothetical protein